MGIYYDRRACREGTTTVICEPCGVKRWGDPDEGDGNAAFNARYDDKSGEWCWDSRWSLRHPMPCADCGGPVEYPPGLEWEVDSETAWKEWKRDNPEDGP